MASAPRVQMSKLLAGDLQLQKGEILNELQKGDTTEQIVPLKTRLLQM